MDIKTPENELPDVPELSERLGTPDPVFEAWRSRQSKKSWVHLDLSALRIGYELGLRAVTAECAELRRNNAAMAALWSKAADRTMAAENRVATIQRQLAKIQPGWRDIATAPRDGTVILACEAETGWQECVEWANDGWCVPVYTGHRDAGFYYTNVKPTRWMLLPPAPCQSEVVDRAEAAEAKAACRASEPTWRDIATAPKDGTIVWAFNGEQVRMRWIEGVGYALWVRDGEPLSDVCPAPDQPTHWMPLPADPALPGDDGER